MALDLDQMTQGRRLRVIRVAAGLTLWDLAGRTGIQPGRLSQIENDRRPGSPGEWERLTAELGDVGLAPPVPA